MRVHLLEHKSLETQLIHHIFGSSQMSSNGLDVHFFNHSFIFRCQGLYVVVFLLVILLHHPASPVELDSHLNHINKHAKEDRQVLSLKCFAKSSHCMKKYIFNSDLIYCLFISLGDINFRIRLGRKLDFNISQPLSHQFPIIFLPRFF